MIKRLTQSPVIHWPNKYALKTQRSRSESLTHFYQQGLPEANCPLENVRFLAMDFETTGLNPNTDDIITIGTVPFDLNRIYLNQARHWTVKPRKQLDEHSVVIHGITHSDLIDAPDLSEIYPEVLEQMAGKIMVVHYKRIEREFFDRALQERIQEGIEFPVVDTMAIETRIQQRNYGGLWNKLRGITPQSVRLGRARTRYNLPPYTPHHALTDAIATAELLQAQIAYHYSPNSPIGAIWE
ncbi:3'-5' exonuclease [Vibrio renipiscarius]|uniref:DNA-directed DNA polymerase n=1 Tax=Vibrio renipiscarius TaxID=1461322 RepID=A0A0C2JDD8_9VIBR|nr:3'-5' exonuclease [Vibrio renipiscarius]KII75954.1 DNA polymerase III subunit epsilon [Vibrio renipiscarius]KII79058.1 DNA polymerase III subunit epsilon [Vibrio renipiscarius]